MTSRSIVAEGDQYRVKLLFRGREYDGGLWPTVMAAITARNRLLQQLLKGEVKSG